MYKQKHIQRYIYKHTSSSDDSNLGRPTEESAKHELIFYTNNCHWKCHCVLSRNAMYSSAMLLFEAHFCLLLITAIKFLAFCPCMTIYNVQSNSYAKIDGQTTRRTYRQQERQTDRNRCIRNWIWFTHFTIITYL